MTDWSALRDAYGPATEVPAILAALTPDPQAEAWNELWSRVCHQGTVYSASFATLPHLRDLAAKWPPGERAAPLILAGAIVASGDIHESARPVEPQADLIRALHALALEALPCMHDVPLFINTLEATLAFEGDSFWGRYLDRLADGEFPGVCTGCGADLHIVVGTYGFFATAEEWVNRPETKRTPIHAASADRLPRVGQWLVDQASKAGHEDVVTWVRHLFGASTCPRCSAAIVVADVVVASDG